MDILDMSVTTDKGNQYVLIIVDCFSRWTGACPLPNKMAVAVADAFFQLIICWFGMPTITHSDQGLTSDGLVAISNRTLLMLLAMFTGSIGMTGLISYLS